MQHLGGQFWKPLSRFLSSIEVATEALEEFMYSDDITIYKPELALVSAPTILLTLEAGVGNKTLPMLLLHVGFQSSINDWSTKTVSSRPSSLLLPLFVRFQLFVTS